MRADVFEASLRSRLTSAPGKELAAARLSLIRSVGHPQRRAQLAEAAERIERANDRLRDIVRHLHEAHTWAVSGTPIPDIAGVVRVIATREQVALDLRLDDVDDPLIAHCVERIIEELLVDCTAGSAVTVSLRHRTQAMMISIVCPQMPSPTTGAFFDELLFAVHGHWSVRPGHDLVRIRLEIPCG